MRSLSKDTFKVNLLIHCLTLKNLSSQHDYFLPLLASMAQVAKGPTLAHTHANMF